MTESVQAMLQRAKLPVTPEEVERLQRNYPLVQGWLGELRFDTVRYAEPATVFSAGETRRPVIPRSAAS